MIRRREADARVDDAIRGDLRGGEPDYVAAARRLHQDIRSGRWPVGSRIPPELQLAQQYGLSRYAMRRALQWLLDLGLISRKQGVGTVVLGTEPRRHYTQRVEGLDDLVQYIKGTRAALLSRRRIVPEGELRQLLDADVASSPTAQWLQLVQLRYVPRDPRPVSFAEVYVAPRFAALPRLRKTLDVPVYALIEQAHGVRIGRVEQVISPVRVSDAQAGLLEVRPGEPALRIVRKYYVGATLADVTVALHPGARFSYSTVFQLDVPGG